MVHQSLYTLRLVCTYVYMTTGSRASPLDLPQDLGAACVSDKKISLPLPAVHTDLRQIHDFIIIIKTISNIV